MLRVTPLTVFLAAAVMACVVLSAGGASAVAAGGMRRMLASRHGVMAASLASVDNALHKHNCNLHVHLVVDCSKSVGGLADHRQASIDLVRDTVHKLLSWGAEVTLYTFHAQANIVFTKVLGNSYQNQVYTNDAVKAVTDALGTKTDGTNLAAAFDLVDKEIGKAKAAKDPVVPPIVVVMTDGEPSKNPDVGSIPVSQYFLTHKDAEGFRHIVFKHKEVPLAFIVFGKDAALIGSTVPTEFNFQKAIPKESIYGIQFFAPLEKLDGDAKNQVVVLAGEKSYLHDVKVVGALKIESANEYERASHVIDRALGSARCHSPERAQVFFSSASTKAGDFQEDLDALRTKIATTWKHALTGERACADATPLKVSILGFASKTSKAANTDDARKANLKAGLTRSKHTLCLLLRDLVANFAVDKAHTWCDSWTAHLITVGDTFATIPAGSGDAAELYDRRTEIYLTYPVPTYPLLTSTPDNEVNFATKGAIKDYMTANCGGADVFSPVPMGKPLPTQVSPQAKK